MNRDYIISKGNSYEEALSSGLAQLNLKLEEVEVETLQEKKSSFFRSGYIKLKITRKDLTLQSAIEQINEIESNIEIENNISTVEEDDFFKIDYFPDGVYVTIIKQNSCDVQNKLKQLVDYLSKKSVKGYDIEVMSKCLHDNVTTPIKIAPYQEEVKVDSDAHIEMKKDKLEAYITIVEADGGKELSFDDAKEKLREKGIIFGINDKKLHDIIDNRIFGVKTLIAQGNKPEHGENGTIIYCFDTHKDYKPQLLEDGTVNFKHLNLINNVKKGQLLVEIIPPTDGTAGKNVLGEEISALKGKPAKVIKGKNIYEDESGLKIYADVDGQVFFRDGKLQVSQVYEIPGDVDHSTGNVTFNGKVTIKGNVKSGFTVEADGDIEVNGVVEGATLLSKGNILLNRGIQGNNQAYLQCSGNLISKYIENTTIKSFGNIEADCILHSNIVAKGNITVDGKKGLIVGGQVRAGEEIRAKIIGSHMGTITNLEVGIDPDEKMRYEKLKEEIAEIKKNLGNLKKTIELLSKLAKDNNLPKSKEEILVKSLKTYEYLKTKHGQLQKEIQLLEHQLQSLSSGKVHAGKIYPGAKIIILSAVRHIYDELINSTLYKKDGDIMIGPYEK